MPWAWGAPSTMRRASGSGASVLTSTTWKRAVFSGASSTGAVVTSRAGAGAGTGASFSTTITTAPWRPTSASFDTGSTPAWSRHAKKARISSQHFRRRHAVSRGDCRGQLSGRRALSSRYMRWEYVRDEGAKADPNLTEVKA